MTIKITAYKLDTVFVDHSPYLGRVQGPQETHQGAEQVTNNFHDLITRMANELDEYQRMLLDDCTVTHRLSDEARAALAEADEPAVPLPLADTHYEWELEDAKGEWQAGGSSDSQSDVEREGMRYLQTYAQDGPHKLIIRQHTTQTINEITNG